MNKLVDDILQEYRNGNVVFMGCNGHLTLPMKNFLRQSADGILYDLNRLPELAISNTDDPRWINDLAVARVIEALKQRIEELEKQLNQ